MQRTIDTALVPRSKKHKGKRYMIVSFVRAITGRMRLMPDFLIIGAQKCGTTSLYHNLTMHPNIAPCSVKEVHYFDVHFGKGAAWYRSHFPSWLYKYIKQVGKQTIVTGESSPYYLFHPHAPRRILEIIPRVKMIAILRNPIVRSYSHYQHEVRKGFETLSFKEAIEKEHERLAGEEEKMLANEHYDSFNHRHYSYLSRGIYVDQLMSWTKWLPRDQLLIVKSEDFYQDTKSAIRRIATFLELPSLESVEYRKFNSFKYPPMDTAMQIYLRDFFKPHNQRLYDFLGADMDWER